MDKATIDAMREILDKQEKSVVHYDDCGKAVIETTFGSIPIKTLRVANRGWKTLIDQADAEQPENQAEPDARDLLTQFTEDLEDAVLSAQKDHEPRVSVVTPRHWKSWSLAEVSAVIRAINGMMEVAPNETKASPSPAEPTIEQCLAAINRAKHRRYGDWTVKASTANCVHSIDENEIRALGAYYLGRERAEAAKGDS